MAKSTTEIFNDKVSLIFEYDNRSPLFVRAANTEIEKNNIDKAIEILNDGLKLYPQYSTAYLTLGKAYTLIGNYGSALKNIKKGSDIINSKRTYDYYLKEIENVKKQRSLFEGSARNIFVDNNLLEYQGTPDLFNEEAKAAEKNNSAIPVEERLGQIANEISSAKAPEASPKDVNESPVLDGISSSHLIVSETLAKIYVAQGEYKEAIEVYKKLIKKHPLKSEIFNQRIKELESELDS